MTEREIYNWFAKDDKFVLIDDVCEAFPNESRGSIQNILNRLCEKGTFYKMSTAFGDMYGIDSTVEDEPVTINPSTGSGMGSLLRATGAFDGYQPISKGLIKDAKLKNYGIDEINAKKFKKTSYSSDDVVEWMNTIGANREFLNTIKQVTLENLLKNLQANGFTGDRLLAYLEGLAKIELEEIAKERAKQYQKIEEIWILVRDGLNDKKMLSSLSKELVKIVSNAEDMTINGGQLYYSVPIPKKDHYKKEFSSYKTSSGESGITTDKAKKKKADEVERKQKREETSSETKKQASVREKDKEADEEEKYQKALSLSRGKKYEKKKEAIELLEELGDYKDATKELAKQKEALASMDEFERYDYIAEEIKNSLKEEDKKQENAYPEKNPSVDKETESWIKQKGYLHEANNVHYEYSQSTIGKLMQAGSFSSLYDPALRPYIDKMREIMNEAMSKRENILDDVYDYFKRVKSNNYSRRSLNKLIEFYEEVYDDGGGYNLVINGTELVNVRSKRIYRIRLDEMKRGANSKPKDPSKERENKENEEQKQIEIALEDEDNKLKNLKHETEENDQKALSLESERINKQTELDQKRASLYDDVSVVEENTRKELQSINDEIQSNEIKEKQLSEELSKTEKELENVFVLNFGKKKELNSVISSLKMQILDVQKKIPDLKDKIKQVERKKDDGIRKLNDYISSLEKRIGSIATEKDELEKKNQKNREEIQSAEQENGALEKIREHFHTIYMIKEYGSKYGYDNEVSEIKEKGLDYDKYLAKAQKRQEEAVQQARMSAQISIENDKDKIRDALKRSRTPQTATMLADKTGLSINRVSALLTQMKEDNEVVRSVEKRKAYFELCS